MIKPFLINKVSEDEVLDICKKMKIDMDTSPYTYNGRKVPRVTSILSDMIFEEYLMAWANNVGLYQRKTYTYFRNKATNIGSAVHAAIEEYIQNNQITDFSSIRDNKDRNQAENAFKAFLDWWRVIEKNQYEVILEETSLITPYCGGTLDLLMEINGKKYLIDFKTSSSLSFKYYLQLAAYRRMLYENLNIVCDGCILLRLDKKTAKYQEVMLDFSNYNDLQFINDCDRAFISLLYAYYNRYNIESNNSYVG